MNGVSYCKRTIGFAMECDSLFAFLHRPWAFIDKFGGKLFNLVACLREE